MDHQTVTCYRCGAVLHAGYQTSHNRFHQDLDKLEKRTSQAEELARRARRG